jgi:hypothetical protein
MTPKQTAVEWLQVQLNEDGKLSAVDFYQAKKMEKQQIMDAFDIRKIDIAFDKKTTSEQYYNETFNTKTP